MLGEIGRRKLITALCRRDFSGEFFELGLKFDLEEIVHVLLILLRPFEEVLLASLLPPDFCGRGVLLARLAEELDEHDGRCPEVLHAVLARLPCLFEIKGGDIWEKVGRELIRQPKRKQPLEFKRERIQIETSD